MNKPAAHSNNNPKGHRKLVAILILASMGMFGFCYALVPLYDKFCEATGLLGKTAKARAQYDKDGTLKNWWLRADSLEFVDRSKAVKTQFDGYVAIDTLHVNGALTLGENIADLGGLNIAYDAFKHTQQGKDTVRIDGLLPDERFFLSFAIARKSKYKDELMRQIVLTDPHSPDQFRVNGPLENFTPFYKSFHIQKGDKMYVSEAERIKIW